MRQVARSSALDAPHWSSASVPNPGQTRRDTLADRQPACYLVEQPRAATDHAHRPAPIIAARRASLPHKSTSVDDDGGNSGIPDVFLTALGRRPGASGMGGLARPRSAMPAPDRRQQATSYAPLAAALGALASGDHSDADSVHEQSCGSRASSPPSGSIPRVSPSLSVDACVLPASPPAIATSASAHGSFPPDAHALDAASYGLLRPPQRPQSALQLSSATAAALNPFARRDSDCSAPRRLHLSPNAFGSALHTRNLPSPPKTRVVAPNSARIYTAEVASDRPQENAHQQSRSAARPIPPTLQQPHQQRPASSRPPPPAPPSELAHFWFLSSSPHDTARHLAAASVSDRVRTLGQLALVAAHVERLVHACRPLWSRLPPELQHSVLFAAAVGGNDKGDGVVDDARPFDASAARAREYASSQSQSSASAQHAAFAHYAHAHSPRRPRPPLSRQDVASAKDAFQRRSRYASDAGSVPRPPHTHPIRSPWAVLDRAEQQQQQQQQQRALASAAVSNASAGASVCGSSQVDWAAVHRALLALAEPADSAS